MGSALRPLLGLLALLLGPWVRLRCGAEVKRDYYEVLELTRDATAADVKKAYKQLARKFHPDKNPAADAQQRFIEIQRAHEVLSDPKKRQEYDSRAGYFTDVDDDSSDYRQGFDVFGRRRGPPDGGRGKILNTAAEINAALHGNDLWLLHVYVDQNELFGNWMTGLPDQIRLGHINVGRSNELLTAAMRMAGGHIDTLPILAYVQKGRRHVFGLSYQHIFFGPLGVVTNEALNFIDYWEKLVPLRGDADLRDFLSWTSSARLMPQGSTRLRVIFIFERRQERHFEVLSAIRELEGYAHVAQLGYMDSLDMYGQTTGVLASLGLRRLPSLVLHDPLHGRHVLYSSDRAVDAAASLATQLIEGRPSRALDFFPIQEFDVFMHKALCGDGGRHCAWVLLFATSAALEHHSEDFVNALTLFSKACETLTTVQDRLRTTFKCFWLRHGVSSHAHDWRKLLPRKRGVGSGSQTDGYTIAALSREEAGATSKLAIADADVAESSRSLFMWFQNAINPHSRITHAEVEWPAIPGVFDPNDVSSSSVQNAGGEEPEAEDPVDWWRKLQTKLSELARHVEMAGRDLQAWLEDTMGDLDSQVVAMCAFTFALILLMIFGLTNILMFKGEEVSEEQALRSLEFWVTVPLTKKESGERFGFGIAGDDPNGRLRVGALAAGGLLESWNSKALSPERRVLEGDYLGSVSDVETGRVAVTALAMKRQLLEASGVTMTAILLPHLRPGLERLTATILLEGLVLSDCARFGSRADRRSDDIEVVQVHGALHEWNAMRRREGASCLNMLELGDRLVSINGHTRVAEHIDAKSPTLLVVKWRTADRLVSERFEVGLERDAQEPWGLKLGILPGGEKHIEVGLVHSNSIAARWNAEAASNGSSTRCVLPGDRLVMANGKQGVEAISRELRTTKIVFCFERWLDKKDGCKADLECETSAKKDEEVKVIDAGNAAGTLEDAAKADSTAEADLGDWDLDPEFDSAMLANCSAGAGADDAAVDSATAGNNVEESIARSTEHQAKQPEDAGWDVDLELDTSVAVDSEVPLLSTDVSSCPNVDAQQQCPASSTTEAPANTDDGWDLEFDDTFQSSAQVVSTGIAENMEPGSSNTEFDDTFQSSAQAVSAGIAESMRPGSFTDILLPQAPAGSSKQWNGRPAETSATSAQVNSAHLRPHRDEAFLMAPAGKSDDAIAQWPVIDPDGHWLQHRGMCVLASGSGSPGYVRSLQALRGSFGEPEYPVRFFCEERLPQGSLLIVLPSCSRCLLVPPERMHSAGGLLWRVLGGDVQALVDSFAPQNFAACLARWRTAGF